MKNKVKIKWLHIKSFFGFKLTNEEIVICIISKELEPFNKTYYDVVKRKDDWYQDYKMTPEESGKWIKWGVKFIKERAKGTCQFRPESEMAGIDLQWGLSIEGGVDAIKEYEKQKKNEQIHN